MNNVRQDWTIANIGFKLTQGFLSSGRRSGWGISLAMVLTTGLAWHAPAQVPAVTESEERDQAIAPPTPPVVDPSLIQRLRLRQPVYPAPAVLDPPFPMPVFPEVMPTLRLVIRLGERRLYVYRDDVVETSYPVAIGKPGWETPVGEHEILNMVEYPDWRNPFTGQVIGAGPQNPLGDRWIGFWTDGNNYIGFHGTPNEGSVGRAASHGCVRMFNNDVRALFEIVAVGTPVIVEP